MHARGVFWSVVAAVLAAVAPWRTALLVFIAVKFVLPLALAALLRVLVAAVSVKRVGLLRLDGVQVTLSSGAQLCVDSIHLVVTAPQPVSRARLRLCLDGVCVTVPRSRRAAAKARKPPVDPCVVAWKVARKLRLLWVLRVVSVAVTRVGVTAASADATVECDSVLLRHGGVDTPAELVLTNLRLSGMRDACSANVPRLTLALSAARAPHPAQLNVSVASDGVVTLVVDAGALEAGGGRGDRVGGGDSGSSGDRGSSGSSGGDGDGVASSDRVAVAHGSTSDVLAEGAAVGSAGVRAGSGSGGGGGMNGSGEEGRTSAAAGGGHKASVSVRVSIDGVSLTVVAPVRPTRSSRRFTVSVSALVTGGLDSETGLRHGTVTVRQLRAATTSSEDAPAAELNLLSWRRLSVRVGMPARGVDGVATCRVTLDTLTCGDASLSPASLVDSVDALLCTATAAKAAVARQGQRAPPRDAPAAAVVQSPPTDSALRSSVVVMLRHVSALLRSPVLLASCTAPRQCDVDARGACSVVSLHLDQAALVTASAERQRRLSCVMRRLRVSCRDVLTPSSSLDMVHVGEAKVSLLPGAATDGATAFDARVLVQHPRIALVPHSVSVVGQTAVHAAAAWADAARRRHTTAAVQPSGTSMAATQRPARRPLHVLAMVAVHDINASFYANAGACIAVAIDKLSLGTRGPASADAASCRLRALRVLLSDAPLPLGWRHDTAVVSGSGRGSSGGSGSGSGRGSGRGGSSSGRDSGGVSGSSGNGSGGVRVEELASLPLVTVVVRRRDAAGVRVVAVTAADARLSVCEASSLSWLLFSCMEQRKALRVLLRTLRSSLAGEGTAAPAPARELDAAASGAAGDAVADADAVGRAMVVEVSCPQPSLRLHVDRSGVDTWDAVVSAGSVELTAHHNGSRRWYDVLRQLDVTASRASFFPSAAAFCDLIGVEVDVAARGGAIAFELTSPGAAGRVLTLPLCAALHAHLAGDIVLSEQRAGGVAVLPWQAAVWRGDGAVTPVVVRATKSLHDMKLHHNVRFDVDGASLRVDATRLRLLSALGDSVKARVLPRRRPGVAAAVGAAVPDWEWWDKVVYSLHGSLELHCTRAVIDVTEPCTPATPADAVCMALRVDVGDVAVTTSASGEPARVCASQLRVHIAPAAVHGGAVALSIATASLGFPLLSLPHTSVAVEVLWTRPSGSDRHYFNDDEDACALYRASSAAMNVAVRVSAQPQRESQMPLSAGASQTAALPSVAVNWECVPSMVRAASSWLSAASRSTTAVQQTKRKLGDVLRLRGASVSVDAPGLQAAWWERGDAATGILLRMDTVAVSLTDRDALTAASGVAVGAAQLWLLPTLVSSPSTPSALSPGGHAAAGHPFQPPQEQHIVMRFRSAKVGKGVVEVLSPARADDATSARTTTLLHGVSMASIASTGTLGCRSSAVDADDDDDDDSTDADDVGALSDDGWDEHVVDGGVAGYSCNTTDGSRSFRVDTSSGMAVVNFMDAVAQTVAEPPAAQPRPATLPTPVPTRPPVSLGRKRSMGHRRASSSYLQGGSVLAPSCPVVEVWELQVVWTVAVRDAIVDSSNVVRRVLQRMQDWRTGVEHGDWISDANAEGGGGGDGDGGGGDAVDATGRPAPVLARSVSDPVVPPSRDAVGPTARFLPRRASLDSVALPSTLQLVRGESTGSAASVPSDVERLDGGDDGARLTPSPQCLEDGGVGSTRPPLARQPSRSRALQRFNAPMSLGVAGSAPVALPLARTVVHPIVLDGGIAAVGALPAALAGASGEGSSGGGSGGGSGSGVGSGGGGGEALPGGHDSVGRDIAAAPVWQRLVARRSRGDATPCTAAGIAGNVLTPASLLSPMSDNDDVSPSNSAQLSLSLSHGATTAVGDFLSPPYASDADGSSQWRDGSVPRPTSHRPASSRSQESVSSTATRIVIRRGTPADEQYTPPCDDDASPASGPPSLSDRASTGRSAASRAAGAAAVDDSDGVVIGASTAGAAAVSSGSGAGGAATTGAVGAGRGVSIGTAGDGADASEQLMSPLSVEEDEKAASLKPVPFLRLRLHAPQIALSDGTAGGSIILAPRSARMLILKGPTDTASKFHLNDSRKPPPSAGGGDVAGYRGEDPARMVSEFHVRLHSVSAFMSGDGVDVDAHVQSLFLSRGHTDDVAKRVRARMDAVLRGPDAVPLSSFRSQRGTAAPDAAEPQALFANNDHLLRCILANADLQCVFANYLYEWTADNTPRTQRRSIFSVNLPHSRAVNAAPMRLVVASREFFSMLHVLKTVLLAPQRQIATDVCVQLFQPLPRDVASNALQQFACLPQWRVAPGHVCTLCGPWNGFGGLRFATAGGCMRRPTADGTAAPASVTEAAEAPRPGAAAASGSFAPQLTVAELKGAVEGFVDAQSALGGDARAREPVDASVRIVEYGVGHVEWVLCSPLGTPVLCFGIRALQGRHVFNPDGGTLVRMDLGWCDIVDVRNGVPLQQGVDASAARPPSPTSSSDVTADAGVWPQPTPMLVPVHTRARPTPMPSSGDGDAHMPLHFRGMSRSEVSKGVAAAATHRSTRSAALGVPMPEQSRPRGVVEPAAAEVVLGGRLFGDGRPAALDRMLQVTAQTSPPFERRVRDGDGSEHVAQRVNVYDHIEVSVFPSADHRVIVSIAKSNGAFLKEYFLSSTKDAAADVNEDEASELLLGAAAGSSASTGSGAKPSHRRAATVSAAVSSADSSVSGGVDDINDASTTTDSAAGSSVCNHDFAVHTRKSFRRVLCHACGEKIGGVLVKVMKCRACKIKFHMRCFEKLQLQDSRTIPEVDGTIPEADFGDADVSLDVADGADEQATPLQPTSAPSSPRVGARSPRPWDDVVTPAAVPSHGTSAVVSVSASATKATAPSQAATARSLFRRRSTSWSQAGDSDRDDTAVVATTAVSETTLTPAVPASKVAPPAPRHTRTLSMSLSLSLSHRLRRPRKSDEGEGGAAVDAGAGAAAAAGPGSHGGGEDADGGSTATGSHAATDGAATRTNKRESSAELLYFRYVRFGHLSVAVSLRGFFRIKLDSVPLEVKDWTARSELLSWQQLLHRLQAHLVRQVVSQAPKLVRGSLVSSRRELHVVPQPPPPPDLFKWPRSMQLLVDQRIGKRLHDAIRRQHRRRATAYASVGGQL